MFRSYICLPESMKALNMTEDIDMKALKPWVMQGFRGMYRYPLIAACRVLQENQETHLHFFLTGSIIFQCHQWDPWSPLAKLFPKGDSLGKGCHVLLVFASGSLSVENVIRIRNEFSHTFAFKWIKKVSLYKWSTYILKMFTPTGIVGLSYLHSPSNSFTVCILDMPLGEII